MSHCFLLGSKRNPKEHIHPLHIRHYIEYLTYDFEKKRIHILGDFIVENSTDYPQSLVFLHRGNVIFENVTDRWTRDKHWTPVLLESAKDEIGLELKNDKHLYLCELDAKPIKVEFLKESLQPWGPERPDDGRFVPFSAYEYPRIAQGTLSLLRVSGYLEGPTYDRLIPNEKSGQPIIINGGQSLLEQIKNQLEGYPKAVYSHQFGMFTSIYLDNPDYYHVLFERIGERTLKILTTSSDMTKVYVNRQVGKNRRVNWFWSDSEFNIYTLANGPAVKLVSL